MDMGEAAAVEIALGQDQKVSAGSISTPTTTCAM